MIWVGLQDGSVVAIDPATNRVTGTAITVDPDVDALADSPAGLWVSTFDGSVALLDPAARRVTVKRRLPGRGAGIAVAGGSVWASDWDHSFVLRFDPTSGALLGAVKTGQRPRESVAAGGYLWVADYADAAVTPIPLPAASAR
jgi:DNA-binding beta-propeller fold protein YncE